MMFREEYKLFGILCVLTRTKTELVYAESEESDSSETQNEVGGGSAHNFTLAPEFVDERFLPWDEGKHTIGFGRPT